MDTKQAQEYFNELYVARLDANPTERHKLEDKVIELRDWLVSHDADDPHRVSVQTELLEVEKELYQQ
jgi:hypothetical protein